MISNVLTEKHMKRETSSMLMVFTVLFLTLACANAVPRRYSRIVPKRVGYLLPIKTGESAFISQPTRKGDLYSIGWPIEMAYADTRVTLDKRTVRTYYSWLREAILANLFVAFILILPIAVCAHSSCLSFRRASFRLSSLLDVLTTVCLLGGIWKFTLECKLEIVELISNPASLIVIPSCLCTAVLIRRTLSRLVPANDKADYHADSTMR